MTFGVSAFIRAQKKDKKQGHCGYENGEISLRTNQICLGGVGVAHKSRKEKHKEKRDECTKRIMGYL